MAEREESTNPSQINDLNVVWLFHMGHTGLVSLFGIFACFLTIFRVNLRVVLFRIS